MDEKNVNAENKFMQFLNDVNKLSVEAGVLPDPVTGKVGAMNAEAILDAVKKMQRTGREGAPVCLCRWRYSYSRSCKD
jgi:hypothetical protein